MCDVLIPDSEYLNFKRCGKPVKDYSHKCEAHSDWRNEETIQDKSIGRIMRYAFNIYNNAIEYAFKQKYDELEKILNENPTNESDIHDIIAAIAIRSRDEKMFSLTNHHQRKIMEDFASDEELFPVLIDWYAKNGGNGRYAGCWEIPSYVWSACTLKNAIMLHKITGEHPELDECKLEIQEHFGYDQIYTLYMKCEQHKYEKFKSEEAAKSEQQSLPRILIYQPPEFREQQSNPEVSQEEIISVMHASLYEDMKHCLSCHPSLFLQKRNGPKICIDKFISYKIFFDGVEYSSIQELKQLDKKCDRVYDDGGIAEICECDISCDDHVGSALENFDCHSTVFEDNEFGFTVICNDYPLTILFSYDLNLFSAPGL